jgi:hypothetical protein
VAAIDSGKGSIAAVLISNGGLASGQFKLCASAVSPAKSLSLGKDADWAAVVCH